MYPRVRIYPQIAKFIVLTALTTLLVLSPALIAGSSAQAQADNGLMFIQNVGQFDEGVRFQLYGSRTTLSLTDSAFWFTVLEQFEPTTNLSLIDSTATVPVQRGITLRFSFAEANPQPQLEPFDRLDTRVSYFSGPDKADWQIDVPVWGGVRYVDLYPGIDLELTGENGQLVQRLVVRAGETAAAADSASNIAENLQDIRLRIDGADALMLDELGRLRLETAIGDFSWPLVQVASADYGPLPLPETGPAVSGAEITTPFTGSIGAAGAVFATGSADLLYSTFLGGGGNLDTGTDLAVDGAGHAYVTGLAYPGFPTTPGVFDTSIDGVYTDAFVAKLNPGGTDLLYATFLGGSDYDVGQGMAVDEAGNAYLVGYTTSPDFPTSPGAFDDSLGGESDAFVVKLNDLGTTLSYATYLGGSEIDFGWGLAVDGAGHAFVTGHTGSADFPITTGAFDPDPIGSEAYVVKVNLDGTGLEYATYLGGSEADYGNDIAVDNGSGDAFITGYTRSDDFPVTPGVFGPGLADGDADAFVARLTADGSSLVYGTYLGGTHYETAQAIAVDEGGYAYVTGFTESGDFPTTPGSFDPTCDDCDGGYPHIAAFVTKVTPDGVELTYSSFLHGSQPDFGYGLAVDGSGRAYVTGYTSSPDFPTTPDAFDPACEGCEVGYDTDAFVVTVNPAGTGLTYATYLGTAAGYDRGYAIAVDGDSQMYLTGSTSSPDFPVTPGAFDPILEGFTDVFVSKLAQSDGPPPLPDHTCAPTFLGAVAVGEMPRGIAVDSARQRVYVANYGSNTVSVIDANTNTVIHTIPNIPTANGLTFDPLHNILWVSSYSTNQLIPIQVNGDGNSFSPGDPIAVGAGPWGVAYDSAGDYVYVANSLADSITVVSNGSTVPAVAATLTGDFSQPFNLAANPATGKVYAANFGSHNVTVVRGTAISKIVDLYDSAQPYGLAVDETRELVYVSTTGTNRVVVIGPDPQRGPDQFYGWAAFYRGFGDRNRPIPLRNIAINPGVGPAGDGGHLWTVTAVADGSEANQALLIPKGWGGYFHYPLATDLGSAAAPESGVAVDRLNDRVYISNGGVPGTVTVLGDHLDVCPGVAPASDQGLDTNRFFFDLFSLAALSKGDVTGDGRVDILDLAFIAANYGGENLAADVNRDEKVDIFDLVTAANNYGQQVR